MRVMAWPGEMPPHPNPLPPGERGLCTGPGKVGEKSLLDVILTGEDEKTWASRNRLSYLTNGWPTRFQ